MPSRAGVWHTQHAWAMPTHQQAFRARSSVWVHPRGINNTSQQGKTLQTVCRLQGEIFAAEGYAKAAGRVGVCIATSGPGATNLVTGLADAMMDSIPLVAITGQVRHAGTTSQLAFTCILGRAAKPITVDSGRLPITTC